MYQTIVNFSVSFFFLNVCYICSLTSQHWTCLQLVLDLLFLLFSQTPGGTHKKKKKINIETFLRVRNLWKLHLQIIMDSSSELHHSTRMSFAIDICKGDRELRILCFLTPLMLVSFPSTYLNQITKRNPAGDQGCTF